MATETFSYADGDLETVGSANWTRSGGAAGAAQVVSNGCDMRSATATAYLYTDLGDTINRTTCVIRDGYATQASYFVAARIVDTNNYVGVQYFGGAYRLYNVVAGSHNAKGSFARTMTAGDQIDLEILTGNQVQVKINGSVEIGPTEITQNPTNTRQGFIVRQNDSTAGELMESMAFVGLSVTDPATLTTTDAEDQVWEDGKTIIITGADFIAGSNTVELFDGVTTHDISSQITDETSTTITLVFDATGIAAQDWSLRVDNGNGDSNSLSITLTPYYYFYKERVQIGSFPKIGGAANEYWLVVLPDRSMMSAAEIAASVLHVEAQEPGGDWVRLQTGGLIETNGNYAVCEYTTSSSTINYRARWYDGTSANGTWKTWASQPVETIKKTPGDYTNQVYVDSTKADDSGDGLSEANAKKTVSAGNTVAEGLGPDTCLVFVDAGPHYIGTPGIGMGASGDETGYINWIAKSGVTPVLQPATADVTARGFSAVECIEEDTETFTKRGFYGLEITGFARGYDDSSNASDVIFESCHIHDCHGSYSDNGAGIHFAGRGLIVYDTEIEDCIEFYTQIKVDGGNWGAGGSAPTAGTQINFGTLVGTIRFVFNESGDWSAGTGAATYYVDSDAAVPGVISNNDALTTDGTHTMNAAADEVAAPASLIYSEEGWAGFGGETWRGSAIQAQSQGHLIGIIGGHIHLGTRGLYLKYCNTVGQSRALIYGTKFSQLATIPISGGSEDGNYHGHADLLVVDVEAVDEIGVSFLDQTLGGDEATLYQHGFGIHYSRLVSDTYGISLIRSGDVRLTNNIIGAQTNGIRITGTTVASPDPNPVIQDCDYNVFVVDGSESLVFSNYMATNEAGSPWNGATYTSLATWQAIDAADHHNCNVTGPDSNGDTALLSECFTNWGAGDYSMKSGAGSKVEGLGEGGTNVGFYTQTATSLSTGGGGDVSPAEHMLLLF